MSRNAAFILNPLSKDLYVSSTMTKFGSFLSFDMLFYELEQHLFFSTQM